ncbi:hypothetical protein [Microbacterium sp. CJ88]|uniref:hypothetical protein n=1 Tax=Microbacterium sp. CJ88 TaxID=3445672 RepID=UPI003F6557BE
MADRKQSAKGAAKVPRHGYAFVTITARDANGFVHHYDTIETRVGSLHEAVAILQLHSTAMEAEHDQSRRA